jgi:hypothetical protein
MTLTVSAVSVSFAAVTEYERGLMTATADAVSVSVDSVTA